MKRYHLHHPIFSLMLVLIFFNSCNGQNKTQSQEIINDPKSVPIGQSKIIKPEGIHQDDNIHCCLMDKAGNLWFGSAGEGVYRYDAGHGGSGQGKLFTHFTENDGLCNNTVWSILEDKNGNIWFGTADGICRYDTRTNGQGKTFTSIPIVVTNDRYFQPYNSPNNNPSVKNEVWSMLQDKSGKLWFGTTDGVYCYNPPRNEPGGQGKFTRFLDDYSIINKSGLHLQWVQCMLEDRTGNIWFGSGPLAFEGICRYDGKSITNFKPDGDGWIRSMLQDKNGNIWFGTRHKGLWRYDARVNGGHEKTYTNFSEKEGLDRNLVYSVTSILEDKAGNIWFAEENSGVWIYDPHLDGGIGQGKAFKNFTTRDGLINNSVWCLVEDRTGDIWVGSRNNGLCRYDARLNSSVSQGKIFTPFTE